MLKDLVIEPFVLDYLEFKILKEEAYDLVLDWYCVNKKIIKSDLKIESFFSKNLKRKIKDGMIFYRAEEKELVIASLSCRDLFDKLGDLYMEANNRSLLNDLSLSRLDLKLMVESKFSKDELEMEHLLLKKKLNLEKCPVSSESGITSYIGFCYGKIRIYNYYDEFCTNLEFEITNKSFLRKLESCFANKEFSCILERLKKGVFSKVKDLPSDLKLSKLLVEKGLALECENILAKVNPNLLCAEIANDSNSVDLSLKKKSCLDEFTYLFKKDDLLVYIFLYYEYLRQKKSEMIIDPKDYFCFYGLDYTQHGKRHFKKDLISLFNSVFIEKTSGGLNLSHLINSMLCIEGHKYEIFVNGAIFEQNKVYKSIFDVNELKEFLSKNLSKDLNIYFCLKLLINIYSMLEFDNMTYTGELFARLSKKKELNTYICKFFDFLITKKKLISYSCRRENNDLIIEVYVDKTKNFKKLSFLDFWSRQKHIK